MTSDASKRTGCLLETSVLEELVGATSKQLFLNTIFNLYIKNSITSLNSCFFYPCLKTLTVKHTKAFALKCKLSMLLNSVPSLLLHLLLWPTMEHLHLTKLAMQLCNPYVCSQDYLCGSSAVTEDISIPVCTSITLKQQSSPALSRCLPSTQESKS